MFQEADITGAVESFVKYSYLVKDVDDIPAKYLKGLRFHYVHDIQEVIDFAIVK